MPCFKINPGAFVIYENKMLTLAYLKLPNIYFLGQGERPPSGPLFPLSGHEHEYA